MFNMYGEHTARLSSFQSRYFQAYNLNPLALFPRVLSYVFLFNQPQEWYLKLCETWVDRTVYAEPWQHLMRDVLKEWKSTSFIVRERPNAVVISADSVHRRPSCLREYKLR